MSPPTKVFSSQEQTPRRFVGLARVAMLICAWSVSLALASARQAPIPRSASFIPDSARWVEVPGIAGSFGYGFRVPFRSPGQDWEAAARTFLAGEYARVGATLADLPLVEVRPIALRSGGGRDKVAVMFSQVRGGLPVHGSGVTLLADAASGDLVAIDIRTLPESTSALDIPQVGTSLAIEVAERAFVEVLGTPPAQLEDIQIAFAAPTLGFPWKNPLTKIGPTLTYQIELSAPTLSPVTHVPAIARVHVAATNPPTVLWVEPRAFSSGDGTVTALINPNGGPNTAPEQVALPLAYVDVRKNGPTGSVLDTTDADGVFHLSLTPTNIYLALAGPYFRVLNMLGVDASISVPAFLGGTIPLNQSQAEASSAEVAAAYWMGVFHDYIKSVDQNDAVMDFQATARVNQAPSCNAFFSPSGVTFMQSGNGCANAAMRSIVLHEMGHWALERYSGQGLSGAFHEGVADAFAYFITGDPCFGEDFDLSKTSACHGKACMRCGEDPLQKCPEGGESCHGGEFHHEGKVLAGALWKVRSRLMASGEANAKPLSDALLLGWLKAFNDSSISQIIVHHLLALDDNDGDLSNLTPHYSQIVLGFADQGFDAEDITAEIVAAPASGAELAPGQSTTISVQVKTKEGAPTAVTLHRSADGVNWTTTAMTEVYESGAFEALLAGPAAGGTVSWYVSATSSFGPSSTIAPRYGKSTPRVAHGGKRVVLHKFDFDGQDDEGWTHTLLAGPFGDQFERGDPSKSTEPTDPAAAYSGTKVFGTDLSTNGYDGRYEPEGSGELRSPLMNFSATPSVRLSYRRYLSVEAATADRAEILVGQVPIWSNPIDQPLIDAAWTLHDLDLSVLAGGQSGASLAWRLTSDDQLEFGGWNVDHVEIYRVDPSGSGFFQSFGSSCGLGGSAPVLSGIGTPATSATAGVRIDKAPPFTIGALLVSNLPGAISFPGGCSLLIAPPILGMIPMPLGPTGSGAIQAPLPAMSIDLYLQFLGYDPGKTNPQVISSNGLRVKTP